MFLLSVPMCGVFPAPSDSLTLAGCPTIQLSSDTIYVESAVDPTVLPDCPPPNSGATRKNRLLPRLLTKPATDRGSSDCSLRVWLTSWVLIQNLEKHFTY